MGTKRTIAMMAGLVICSPLAAEQMCKWVDEHGTVHYAENCPETGDGESIQIDQGPPPEVIEAAQQRAEKQLARKAEQKRTRLEGKAAESDVRQAATLSGAPKDQCNHALRDFAVLKQQLPVYADTSGVYHLRSSLHFWYYEGKHLWLEDQKRQAELDRCMQIIENQCADTTTADLPHLQTYRNPPAINETLRHFEAYNPENVPQAYREEATDWCIYGRRFLAQDETLSLKDPGIPRLRELIEAKCL